MPVPTDRIAAANQLQTCGDEIAAQESLILAKQRQVARAQTELAEMQASLNAMIDRYQADRAALLKGLTEDLPDRSGETPKEVPLLAPKRFYPRCAEKVKHHK